MKRTIMGAGWGGYPSGRQVCFCSQHVRNKAKRQALQQAECCMFDERGGAWSAAVSRKCLPMKVFLDGWNRRPHLALPKRAAGFASARSRCAALPCALLGALLALSATAIAQPVSSLGMSPLAKKAAKIPASSAASGNRADAYYHFALGHLYEGAATDYGRADLATQAVEQYKLAIDNDPNAPFLQNSLAKLYFRMGHIRKAVAAAQQVLQQHPNNLDAHTLLGRVYLHSLGDASGQPSAATLHLAIGEFEKIVALEPNKIEAHLMLGQLYGMDHDTAKAKEQLEAAHRINPNSEDAVLSLVRLYGEQGDMQHVIQLLTSVSPDDRTPKMEFALGNAYDQIRDTKNAILSYQTALDTDPDNLDAQRGLAQDLLQTGKDTQALQLFQGIAAEDPEDVQSYLRVAELEREKGHLNKAQTALEHAATLEPDSVEVHYDQALLDEAQGQLASAADILQKLVAAATHANGVYAEGDKNNLAIFLDRLATVDREQNKTEQAVTVYKKMIALGGDYAERGYQGVVDAYRDGRMWPQATAAAETAVQANPKSIDLKLTLAGELADTGKGDAGIAMAKSLLQNASAPPDITQQGQAKQSTAPQSNATPAASKNTSSVADQNRIVLLTLVQIYTRLHRWKDAASTLDQAQALSAKPKDMMFIYFLRGAMEERQKHYDAAEVEFRKSLALSPDNPLTLNYLGYMMADHNMHLDEALKMIQHAVQLDPQNGAYLDSLGWADLKMGQYALAEANLEKAIARMPNDPTVHDHMGELYAKTGRIKQAIAQWERSLQEYSHAAPGDAEPSDINKVEKKLARAKIEMSKLAKEEAHSTPAHK